MSREKSILQGKDYEVLDILIDLHCGLENPFILDSTYNSGKMWKKCKYQPSITMDISQELKPLVIGDFKKLPFKEKVFDVVVYDPPHLPSNGASVNSSKIWEKTYGITNDGKTRQGDNVSDLFLPFLEAVRKVIKPEGILITKLADLTHNHKYQWQMVDFINACRELNIIPCDMMIKQDPAAGNLTSSKWKNIKHLRKAHCYFIVCRFNGKCEKK